MADVIGELTTTSVGNDLKFHLSIELSGDVQPKNDVIEKLNKILKEVSDKLKL